MCVRRVSAWSPLTPTPKTELILNTHIIVADMHQGTSKAREGTSNQDQAVSDPHIFDRFPTHAIHYLDSEQASHFDYRRIGGLIFASSTSGELPPPPPRAFFGREELINTVVCFAECLTPVALIGPGGIGKTSIVLTVLHDDRIKQRFGPDRRFIRCDEFPASCAHFLRQLSKVTGAGIENPENISPLRSFLSSKEMVIVLDNAESILDPQGPNAKEIYAAVNELTQLSNICLCITSRISTIPPDCETLEIPTLSMEAAQDAFYRIYKREQTDPINGILEQLDFHPLSITLLATVGQYNKWGTDRLLEEWESRRTGVLNAQHSGSLATTIELSLASPMFRELGPDARSLLEVVAFLPQGVNEKDAKWLFPTISDAQNMLDKFCILSLAYRNDGFVTMLAPLRDHLRPKDPALSMLLRTTKECYFARLIGDVEPGQPGFEEARWIASEDINVEYLLDVFTTIDANSESVWDACEKFMAQLSWYKLRLVTLGPKIEALPDGHPSKARCLFELSGLFGLVGNVVECKRLLTYSLKLCREQGGGVWVARVLRDLSEANRRMGLFEEGIRQAKEASEIFERLGHVDRQAKCLIYLAFSLHDDGQLDAAEEAGSRAIELLPEKGQEFYVCKAHRVLGLIYQWKDETKKAIHHMEMALEIASSLNTAEDLFWVNLSLAGVFSQEGKFDDAQIHVESARSYAADNPYLLARASLFQAQLWYAQSMFGEAKSEGLHALAALEKLGVVGDAEYIREFLRRIDARATGEPEA